MKKMVSAKIQGVAGDQLLRTAEVLSLLRISRATMRELVFQGVLNPVMIGKKAQRFSSREINAFIESIKSKRVNFKPVIIGKEFTKEEVAVLDSICAEIPG